MGQHLGQVLVAGISNGALYALIALGFGLVFSVNGFLSLIQGEFVAAGGLLAIYFSELHNWALLPSAIAAVLIVSVLGLTFHAVTLSPQRQLSADTALMVTFGGAYVFRGVAMVLFGKQPLSLSSFSGEAPILIGKVALSSQTLWILGALVFLSSLMWWFFTFTFVGKAMLACSESRNGAQLVGIDLRYVTAAAFTGSAALGAITGVVSTPLTFATYDSGLALALKGFIAAVLGGLGSFPGALLGGFVLGIGEAITAGYLSSDFKEAITFAGLLALLLFRPNGILGTKG